MLSCILLFKGFLFEQLSLIFLNQTGYSSAISFTNKRFLLVELPRLLECVLSFFYGNPLDLLEMVVYDNLKSSV